MYEQQKAEELAAQEYVLLKIQKRKAAEQDEMERAKNAAFVESMGRLNELSFSFSFNGGDAEA